MKVALIGSGGREHAIARTLSQHKNEVHVFPGNPGMIKHATVHLDQNKFDSTFVDSLSKSDFELVVIGPEQPLCDGLADQLRKKGMNVVGPGEAGAQLEKSKIYAKKFMEEFQIPTSKYSKVESSQDCLLKAQSYTAPYVLKMDGLAGGKGVFVCKDISDLEKAAQEIFPTHQSVFLEEFVQGWELSYIVLTDGDNYQACPLTQDHKRLLDGDHGPNTGGMGVVGPLQIEDELNERIHEKIVLPTLKGLKSKGITYRGVLYFGLMINDQNQIQVLEYNVRFGDPETQVIFSLLKEDPAPWLLSVSNGQISPTNFSDEQSSAYVVLAAPGYPDKPIKNLKIEGDIFQEIKDKHYFIASAVNKNEDHFVTSGGRVLGSLGLGADLGSALETAYENANKISWKGLQMRSDIGKNTQ